jgi:hypothetical protein
MFMSVNTGRPLIPQSLAIGVQTVQGSPRIPTLIFYSLCNNYNTDTVKRQDFCAQILEKWRTKTRLRKGSFSAMTHFFYLIGGSGGVKTPH